MGLLHRNKNGDTLYAVCWENFRTMKTGVSYFHAKNKFDAVNQMMQSNLWGPQTRVVGIAPAIGVHYDENVNGEPIRLIYQ